MDGIYRDCAKPTLEQDWWKQDDQDLPGELDLLHPKYKIPVHCFAYVGHAEKTSTWKLPYRLADGSIDD
ncbi:MAG: hypothetical protein M1298_03290 [Chloroflexi bacterium]|nr:hypothetical protein [Chloroflexota bacterium]